LVLEYGKRKLAGKEELNRLSSWKLLTAGGIAGMAFWVSIYPIDVIKSRMQADTPDPSKRKFKSMIGTFGTIMKENGVGGFFKGFAPCMLRSFPANAVAFLGYEQVRRLLG
jgi:solute carrier family 25 carnitine/acylcarnitine transporter 20/29